MPRNIPTPTKLLDASTTMTRLLKVMLKNGVTYGICMTNKDVTYDDQVTGPLLYVAANSFDPSLFATDGAYSVDNAEGYALISNDIPGVTVEMVNAGALDDAQWVCYYVDYEDPVAGTAIILDEGDMGQVRTDHGMVWTPELLSYMMRLKQPVGGVFTCTCRAVFGTPAASQTGCGVDATALWQNFTVSTVGAENDRTFTITGAAGTFFPGRLQFYTGDNAGPTLSIEEVATGYVVTLAETTNYPVQVGDTGRIRIDCDKTKTMCKDVHNNYPNMKAEDTIPVGDAAAVGVPGGQV